MLGSWLMYLLSATVLAAAYTVASPAARRSIKRAHKQVWRWNANVTTRAVRATRPGKWWVQRKTARAEQRKMRPPRLTFGRLRPEGTPALATRMWAARERWRPATDRLMARLVGENRTRAVAPDPADAAPMTLADPAVRECGAPTTSGPRNQRHPCRNLVTGPGHCHYHGGRSDVRSATAAAARAFTAASTASSMKR